MENEKTMYPTEVIDLPSRGLLYPKESKLASGKIELKLPTAKEEDILTNQNLIQKNIVIDKFLQSIIMDDVDYNDLLIGDKNAIMVAARILAYGSEYLIDVTCPKCGKKESEYDAKLSDLDFKPIDEALFKNKNEFEFVLPSNKVSITFKALTVRDEKKIEDELKHLKKVYGDSVPELTTRLKYIITSVNGDSDIKTIRDFVDNKLLSKDSLEFRKYAAKILPDMDMRIPFTCGSCGAEEWVRVPMTVQFFWPHAGI